LGSDEYKRFQSYFGVLYLIRTRRFAATMDRLGSARISKPVGWILLYIMPIAAAFGFYLFLSELGVLLNPNVGSTAANYVRSLGPLAILGLPGINPYLPIVDGWIALIVAMVIHEGAHGIVARSLGLPVKAAGLMLFLFVPIGAFVDVDESAMKEAKASHSGRVLAAGAGINFVVGLVCLLLLIGTVSLMRPPVPHGIGVIVVDKSPLNSAGIRTYDYIIAANGKPLNSVADIGASSWYKINNTVTLTVWRGGTTFDRNVTIGTQRFENTSSHQNFTRPFLGINLGSPSSQGVPSLSGLASSYSGAITSRPFVYICIPTLPVCQSLVPFSDTMAGFYTSSFGPALVPLANLLYWMFFLNFNLAVFNAIPIYPLDGGQAFSVAVRALGKGKLSDVGVLRITSIATFAVLALIVSVLAIPYFYQLVGR
jgi:membrane-associated protease RseP (regulator of RpoE activity)